MKRLQTEEEEEEEEALQCYTFWLFAFWKLKTYGKAGDLISENKLV